MCNTRVQSRDELQNMISKVGRENIELKKEIEKLKTENKKQKEDLDTHDRLRGRGFRYK